MKLSEKLVGSKVILERPRPDKAQAKTIFAHIEISKASMRPWLDWVDKVKTADDRLKFLQYVDECWEQGKEFSYSIYRRDNQTYAGHISVVNLDFDKMSAKFGYWLSDMAVGFGFMREAVSLLETELKNRGFKEVIIEADEENLRSNNVPKALGYQLDKDRCGSQYSALQNRLRRINFYIKRL